MASRLSNTSCAKPEGAIVSKPSKIPFAIMQGAPVTSSTQPFSVNWGYCFLRIIINIQITRKPRAIEISTEKVKISSCGISYPSANKFIIAIIFNN